MINIYYIILNINIKEIIEIFHRLLKININ